MDIEAALDRLEEERDRDERAARCARVLLAGQLAEKPGGEVASAAPAAPSTAAPATGDAAERCGRQEGADPEVAELDGEGRRREAAASAASAPAAPSPPEGEDAGKGKGKGGGRQRGKKKTDNAGQK